EQRPARLAPARDVMTTEQVGEHGDQQPEPDHPGEEDQHRPDDVEERVVSRNQHWTSLVGNEKCERRRAAGDLGLELRDVDQLEHERLDLVEQAVQLRLVAQLSAHHGLGWFDSCCEVLERATYGIAEAAPDPNLIVGGYHSRASLALRGVMWRHPT